MNIFKNSRKLEFSEIDLSEVSKLLILMNSLYRSLKISKHFTKTLTLLKIILGLLLIKKSHSNRKFVTKYD